VAEEGKKRGQAVCYFEAAVERLKEAWKNAEKISSDKTTVFKDVHTFTSDVLMGKSVSSLPFFLTSETNIILIHVDSNRPNVTMIVSISRKCPS
jgi:hypothetical protein